jgi:beta-lactamase regulating signal transducer with metallopeptidase domain
MNFPGWVFEFLSALGLQSLYVLVVFLVLAIPIVRSRNHPQWEYSLWILIMLRFILPVNLAMPFSLAQWMQSLRLPLRLECFFAHHSAGTDFGGTSLSQLSEPLLDWPGALNTAVIDFLDIWGIFWGFGAIIMMVVFIVRYRSYQRHLNQGRKVTEIFWLTQSEKLQRRLGIRRKISLVTAPALDSPFTTGILKPIIFIPEKVIRAKDVTLKKAILTHEFMHIKRFDQFFNHFTVLILIFFFFHPLAWLMSRRMMLCRESLCDQYVLRHSRLSRAEYGASLISVLGLSLKQPPLSGISGFGLAASQIHYRLVHLKGGPPMKKRKRIALIATALFLLPMAVQSNSSQQNTPDQQLIDSAPVDLTAPIRQGRISAPFGPMIDPFKKIERHHKGIDIAAETGTTLYAAADGKVVFVQKEFKAQQGYGKNVIIDHGSGVQTRYAKMERIFVKSGDQVKKGQQIGEVGSTGISTGPHLHFELKMGKDFVNPQDYIDFSGLN